MVIMTSEDFITRLKVLAARKTYYKNKNIQMIPPKIEKEDYLKRKKIK